MKRNRFIIIILVALCLFGCKGKPDGAVAKVGNEVITIEEFKDELKNYSNIYKASYPEELSQLSITEKKDQGYILRSGVLQKLVNRKIIEIESKKLKEIDESLFKEKRDQIIMELGDEEGFKDFLNKNSLDEEFFNRAVREDVLTSLLKSEFEKNYKFDIAELEKLYNEDVNKYNRYKIGLILVETEEEAYEIMRSDNNFSELAILYSKDVESSINGGIIENYRLGDKTHLLDSFILSGDGKLTGPIKTEDGYYIVQVVEKYEGFEQNKEYVESEFLDMAFKNHLKEIREKSKVRVYINLDDPLED